MGEAVSGLGSEIIHTGGVFGAGVVLGAVTTLVVMWLSSKMFAPRSTDSQWGELVKSLYAEISRWKSTARSREKELEKCRKELKR